MRHFWLPAEHSIFRKSAAFYAGLHFFCTTGPFANPLLKSFKNRTDPVPASDCWWWQSFHSPWLDRSHHARQSIARTPSTIWLMSEQLSWAELHTTNLKKTAMPIFGSVVGFNLAVSTSAVRSKTDACMQFGNSSNGFGLMNGFGVF